MRATSSATTPSLGAVPMEVYQVFCVEWLSHSTLFPSPQRFAFLRRQSKQQQDNTTLLAPYNTLMHKLLCCLVSQSLLAHKPDPNVHPCILTAHEVMLSHLPASAVNCTASKTGRHRQTSRTAVVHHRRNTSQLDAGCRKQRQLQEARGQQRHLGPAPTQLAALFDQHRSF